VPSTDARHRAQAQHNADLSTKLAGDSSDWNDWAVTTIFYAAVHEIQAFLVRQGIRTYTHETRKAELRKAHHPSDLFTLYETLEDHSRNARYECWDPLDNDVVLCRSLLEMVRSVTGSSAAGASAKGSPKPKP
jgi:hypothetical protein